MKCAMSEIEFVTPFLQRKWGLLVFQMMIQVQRLVWGTWRSRPGRAVVIGGARHHVTPDAGTQGAKASQAGAAHRPGLRKHHVVHLARRSIPRTPARSILCLCRRASPSPSSPACRCIPGLSAHLCAGPLTLQQASPPPAGLPQTESASHRPTARIQHSTSRTMSGPVATARPTQALRLRRESQRPGVARTVTRTPAMEDEAVKHDSRRYGTSRPSHCSPAHQLTFAQSTRRPTFSPNTVASRHRCESTCTPSTSASMTRPRLCRMPRP